MNAAIFLDKDGTLVEDVPYNVDPRRIVLASQAGVGLRLFRRLGYRLLAVSNQPGVALGHFDEAALALAWQHLQQLLRAQGVELDGYYNCPHHPDGVVPAYACACLCRKPQPGMLLRAAREHSTWPPAGWSAISCTTSRLAGGLAARPSSSITATRPNGSARRCVPLTW